MVRIIICISGLSGSGKNSVGTEVAKLLGLRLIDPTFKTIAAQKKMDLMEFHRKAEKEHSIDKDFDARLIAQTKGGRCVVTTWLGPWMIKNADIRVWLYAPREARAVRLAKRDNMTEEGALAHIIDRDESNRLRYLEIYKIDIYDHAGFDLVINSEEYLPAQSAQIIAAAARAKMEGFESAKKPTNKKPMSKKSKTKTARKSKAKKRKN